MKLEGGDQTSHGIPLRRCLVALSFDLESQTYLFVILNEKSRLCFKLIGDVHGRHAIRNDHTLEELLHHLFAIEYIAVVRL